MYVTLPATINSEIDFEFIDGFIAELEAQRIAELEAQRIAELEAHLTVTGLKDYILTEEEHNALDGYDDWEWKTFNLEDLFGKSTRGKRLKRADRIPGELPFVTAGEADEGISDFIGNNVTIFSENTTTIDMFGSAKYRNYRYGGMTMLQSYIRKFCPNWLRFSSHRQFTNHLTTDNSIIPRISMRKMRIH